MKIIWEQKALREITSLIKGKKPKIFEKKSEKIYLTAKVIRGLEPPKCVSLNCKTSVWVRKKDIVIIMDGSNSGEIFTGLDGALASTMGIIDYHKQLVTQKYLLYFLTTKREKFTESKTGSAIPHLNKEVFEQLQIPLPSLPEQKRIVALLDEVFVKLERAKEIAEKNLKNAKEVFESYLDDLFFSNSNFEKKTLEEICIIEYGYTEKAKNFGDLRFVRITDTDDCGLLTQTNKMYINSFEGQSRYLLNSGDLLMARTGASAGNVLMFEGNEKAVFASYLIRLKFSEGILHKLYWYFTKSKFYWRQVKELSAGSAQPQFNGGALKKIVFSFPKFLSEQKSIVARLDELSAETKKLESIYKQKLAAIEELKKSILQKAFSGEL